MMTAEEKLRLYELSREVKERGNIEEAERIFFSVPISPKIAKIAKEVYGAEALKNSDYDLSEAEAEYGKDWLDK